MKKSAQQKLKHKPNTRHTLNEVLHSLQDLMHNELAEITDNGSNGASADTTKSRSKEEVLKSLQALIGKPKGTLPLNDKSDSDLSLEFASEENAAAMDKLPDENNTTPTGLELDTGPVTTGIGGDQEEIPSPPPADEFRLEMEQLHQPETESRPEKKPAQKNASRRPRDKSVDAAKHGKGEQVEIHWDDIPVLSDVVAPPPEPDSATTREAREIAIKVAAMLNIETRKKGGESKLDARTIMRLQSLLSQELQERQEDDNEAAETDNNAGDTTRDDDA